MVVGALAGWIVLALMAPLGLVAFAWAALLPIEVLRGVTPWGLDAARYLGVLLMVLRVPATISMRSGRWRTWALLLCGMGVARLALAGIQLDRSDAKVGLVALSGAVAGLLVASRPLILRHVIRGLLTGSTLSGVVVLCQVLGFRTIGGPLTDNLRYPGLSPLTTAVVWPLALAIVIGGWALLGRPRDLVPRRAALASIVVCSVALIACGAQSGFVGLLVAFGFTGRDVVRALPQQRLRVIVPVIAGGFLAVVAVVSVFDVDGFVPDKGFVNESSRVESWVDGLAVFRDHPLLGVTDAEYRRDHDVRPHAVAIDAAVSAGIIGGALGVALSWQLLRLALAGRNRPDARVLGASIAAVLLPGTMLDPGVFTGLSRVVYVLLAVAAIEEYRSFEGTGSPEPLSS